jgi:ubiquinone/menaquinone biosynthesis C-methylase UbiE
MTAIHAMPRRAWQLANSKGIPEMTAPSIDRSPPPAAEHIPFDPAEAYEEFAVPALFAPAAEQLLAIARPTPGERVLDVGTGTGIVARLTVPRVGPTGSVAGIDASAGMLTVARAAAARDDLAITWQEGTAEDLPFPEASFDLVLSQFALMFFADVPAALSEMWRVLAPGGRVTLSVFQGIDHHPFYAALDEAIARQLGKSTVAAIFALGDADALAASLVQAGFRDVAIEPFSMTVRMGPPEMFLAGEIELDAAALPSMQFLSPTARQELVEAITAEMAEPLRAVTDGGEVVMAFHTLIARANH